MAKNPALTRKLIQRMEQHSGEKILSEGDRKKLENEDRTPASPKRASGSPEKQVLTEAQSTLVDIKSKFPNLAQHTEQAYMQIGQIIKLMEKGKERNVK